MRSFSITGKVVKPVFITGFLTAVLAAGSFAAQPEEAPLRALAAMPLYFQAGIAEGGVPEFVAQGRQHVIVIKPGGADLHLFRSAGSGARAVHSRQWLSADRPTSAGTIKVEFLGSNQSAPLTGMEEMPGKVNYLTGSDPDKWRTGLPIFGSVKVQGLYSGIDLVYYGSQQQLEYDFTISPGTAPGLVRMRFAGADRVRISDSGELVLELQGAEMRHHKPLIYQIVNGKRQRVAGGFDMLDSATVGFWVGSYDKSLPLVVDPVLSYSSYFGGSGGDLALSVKVDAQGSIYIAGETVSKSFGFPVSTNALQSKFRGGSINGDGFVAKFDSTGSNLVYFTYLGGKANDGILDLAIDSEGNAYVTGFTASPDFPLKNALYSKIHGVPDPILNVYPNDAFVSEINSTGSALVYSTYLGGKGNDVGAGIAVDFGGSAFITGYTRSTNFPVVNALPGKTKLAGGTDAFVVRLGAGGTNCVYSLLLGGGGVDQGEGIAVDDAGFAYVTGYTESKNFQITNAFQTKLNGTNGTATGIRDAFVTKLSPVGGLVYSTYVGGSANDAGFRIAVDGERNALVTGYAQSKNFPLTVTNIPALNQVTNANKFSQGFLLKVGTDTVVGSQTNGLGDVTYSTNEVASLLYSAVFGGTGDDVAWDVAVDARGDAFVTGITLSANFPVFNTSGFLSATNSGKRDAFVMAFNSDASRLLYSAYLGGKGDDFAYGIAVNAGGDAYVVGRTISTNFPVTGALQSTRVGPNDAFVGVIALDPAIQQSVPPPAQEAPRAPH